MTMFICNVMLLLIRITGLKVFYLFWFAVGFIMALTNLYINTAHVRFTYISPMNLS